VDLVLVITDDCNYEIPAIHIKNEYIKRKIVLDGQQTSVNVNVLILVTYGKQ
jgi:hypothetical protein